MKKVNFKYGLYFPKVAADVKQQMMVFLPGRGKTVYMLQTIRPIRDINEIKKKGIKANFEIEGNSLKIKLKDNLDAALGLKLNFKIDNGSMLTDELGLKYNWTASVGQLGTPENMGTKLFMIIFGLIAFWPLINGIYSYFERRPEALIHEIIQPYQLEFSEVLSKKISNKGVGKGRVIKIEDEVVRNLNFFSKSKFYSLNNLMGDFEVFYNLYNGKLEGNDFYIDPYVQQPITEVWTFKNESAIQQLKIGGKFYKQYYMVYDGLDWPMILFYVFTCAIGVVFLWYSINHWYEP